MILPLTIPAGAITVAAPPALVGEANAEHVGMTAAELRAILRDMERDIVYGKKVLVLSRRPRRLAAAPGDVIAFLQSARTPVAPPSAEAANDAAEAANGVLREMGLR